MAVSKLEPELRDSIVSRYGGRVQHVYFNKGLWVQTDLRVAQIHPTHLTLCIRNVIFNNWSQTNTLFPLFDLRITAGVFVFFNFGIFNLFFFLIQIFYSPHVCSGADRCSDRSALLFWNQTVPSQEHHVGFPDEISVGLFLFSSWCNSSGEPSRRSADPPFSPCLLKHCRSDAAGLWFFVFGSWTNKRLNWNLRTPLWASEVLNNGSFRRRLLPSSACKEDGGGFSWSGLTSPCWEMMELFWTNPESKVMHDVMWEVCVVNFSQRLPNT